MQRLKEDIKNKILSAALEEFAEKGFEKASMLKIAMSAGITVGNMYRYCSNKEQLFSAVVGPVYEEMTSLIKTYDPVREHKAGNTSGLEEEVAELITKMYSRHKTVLLILLNGSRGSKFSSIKEELIALLQQRIASTLPQASFPDADDTFDPLFPRIMAIGFWEGLIAVLKESADTEQIKKLSQLSTRLYFKDIFYRLE